MKRAVSAIVVLMLLLTAAFAAAEGYSPDEANAENIGGLLSDLANAAEAPSEAGVLAIDADLEAIRAVSETDYEIASAIAAHWKRVYLDPEYALYRYSGGERAEELENAGLREGDVQAIVVLGYKLENGEMTRELIGRCDAAAAVARSFPGAILVCSGGATGENNPRNHTEAGLMKEYLTKRCGIAGERVFTDENAMTTVENALNTFEILRSQGVSTMTIVTSTYHQRWGQAVYNAVGAIWRLETGYDVEIVGNYCFEIPPSNEAYRKDYRIAVMQMGSVLDLPREVLSGLRN